MRYRLILIGLIITSCTTNRMIETDLYFGMAIPGGGMVTNQEWNNFKENNISMIFKEGSTVTEATGNWRDPENHQLITEPTHVVVYFHKNSAMLSRKIDSLREAYKTKFRQQSVLRVDKKASITF